jgi:hypothetical protein
MTKNVSYYEVDIRFKAPTGTTVPVTASSAEEAKSIAQEIFNQYDDLEVTDVRIIEDQPARILN